jgi:hypothetical protein
MRRDILVAALWNGIDVMNDSVFHMLSILRYGRPIYGYCFQNSFEKDVNLTAAIINALVIPIRNLEVPPNNGTSISADNDLLPKNARAAATSE